ncbi:MAG: hypothetical protein ACPGU4_00110 [Flavobacteriales bacterium]
MYNEGIDKGLADGFRNEIVARKIYLSFPTKVFDGKPEIQFDIQNKIASFFNVPITAVQVAGSAKTGYSYYKNRGFIEGESDLDIAIVDKDLFINYTEMVFRETRGFSNLASFGRTKDGDEHFPIYRKYLSKGIFRPDLMPSGNAKKKWFNFFNKLSEPHFELFKSINAGIYLSSFYFEFKQSNNIELYKDLK